jgi:transcriptional regulator with XRE-family HTH domain
MTQAHERTATLSELVAEEIRALMARRKVSGRELSAKLGVSPSWISYRLSGKQPIDVNDLLRIANVLGVGVHDLLPPPEIAARATEPTEQPAKAGVGGARGSSLSDKYLYGSLSRSDEGDDDRKATPPPIGPGRTDPVRPMSAVPARHRRPQPTRPGVRRMPR